MSQPISETIALRPGFERLLFGVLLASTIGDEITQVALVFRVAPAGSGPQIAALLIALLLPGALVAPYAGKLVDHHDAAKILAATSLAQAFVSGVIAFTGGVTAALTGAAMLSFLFAFSGAATFTLVPIVGRAAGLSVARVNAATEFASGGGSVFGPLAGGLLVASGGTAVALLFDAASFLLLGLVIVLSHLSRPGAPDADNPGWTPVAVFRGYAPIARQRRIMLLLASFWVVIMALAIADGVYVFLVTNVLSRGPFAYGAFIAVWAGAYLISAWAAGGYVERNARWTALVGLGSIAASFLAIGLTGALAPSLPLAVVAMAFLIGGAGNAIYNVSVRTILHTTVRPELHGRAAALYGAGTRISEGSGFAIGGLLGPARVLIAYILSGVVALVAAGGGSIGHRSR
ncbi:MFS transporter [Candidatus Poribacteria bacterium]|uniref:MFS transporter n=2 Tax=Sphingomonas TaxID=13687 RepID=UPI000B443BDD|nr:MFS transporter [Sphingomonas sp. BE270]MAJ74001.1 MFS transporter [Candidatus Poribacteria bacterium]OUT58536.1 MAG: hypothetical protein CBB75_12900 [bacterium TMED15]